jgi:hypothetical protein
MKNNVMTMLVFAFLTMFGASSVYAQPPGRGDKPPKDNPPGGYKLYVFGQARNYQPNPGVGTSRSGGYPIALSGADPVVAVQDNCFRFVVVPKGPGVAKEFSVSVLLNDVAHMLLSSKDAFQDANGFYFQFSPKEAPKLKPGKHKLMLVIDPEDKTLVRDGSNQRSVDFIVK